MATEKTIRLADRVRPPDAGPRRMHAKNDGRSACVGTSRKLRLALLELIDQVQLVVPLDRLLVCLRGRIADRRQQQHQRRQPLLPVHNQEGGDATRSRRKRREYDTAEEMPGRARRRAIDPAYCSKMSRQSSPWSPSATCTAAATAAPGTASPPARAASGWSPAPAPAEHRGVQTSRSTYADASRPALEAKAQADQRNAQPRY